ncbi:MAG: ATP-binding cassette domain-containing protein [Rhizomicrobium sp.]
MLFRDLSFRVEPGQVLSLEGANGAGKTSLLRMIAGFLAPPPAPSRSAQSPTRRSGGGGSAGSAITTPPSRSLRRAKFWFFSRASIGPTPDIGGALGEVGLAPLADLPCQYLSAGQKKRLALARLKLSRRSVWLLDEPLAALDADGKGRAAGLVRAHCLAGGIAVAATHEPLGIACERLTLGASA